MSTTWPVLTNTNQVESNAWFSRLEKKKPGYERFFLTDIFFLVLTKLIVFNFSAVELTPHHVFSYKTRSVSCFKIISLQISS